MKQTSSVALLKHIDAKKSSSPVAKNPVPKALPTHQNNARESSEDHPQFKGELWDVAERPRDLGEIPSVVIKGLGDACASGVETGQEKIGCSTEQSA